MTFLAKLGRGRPLKLHGKTGLHSRVRRKPSVLLETSTCRVVCACFVSPSLFRISLACVLYSHAFGLFHGFLPPNLVAPCSVDRALLIRYGEPSQKHAIYTTGIPDAGHGGMGTCSLPRDRGGRGRYDNDGLPYATRPTTPHHHSSTCVQQHPINPRCLSMATNAPGRCRRDEWHIALLAVIRIPPFFPATKAAPGCVNLQRG